MRCAALPDELDLVLIGGDLGGLGRPVLAEVADADKTCSALIGDQLIQRVVALAHRQPADNLPSPAPVNWSTLNVSASKQFLHEPLPLLAAALLFPVQVAGSRVNYEDGRCCNVYATVLSVPWPPSKYKISLRLATRL